MSCCTPSEKAVTHSNVISYCPTCEQPSQPVHKITPRHTLKIPLRTALSTTNDYHFCENPKCDTVYFSSDWEQSFATKQLINRVTCKDPSPETPLCYCYKITRGDVTADSQDSGESNVVQHIEEKMAERDCFCDRSNPRGVCCIAEIKEWLKGKGIREGAERSSDSDCGSSCC